MERVNALLDALFDIFFEFLGLYTDLFLNADLIEHK
jgi:hypothetical protein